MTTFDEAFDRLVGHEGGYSNNPADPGGETMWGITLNVAHKHGYRGSMRELPLITAKKIARVEYWDAVRADELPEAIRFDVFDGAYNSGPSQSIKWLQRAVYATPDGDLGPKTLGAVSKCDPEAIACRYNGHRLDFMNDLKTWGSFSRGWSQRIAVNLINVKG